MKTENQRTLKMYVKARQDAQETRKAFDNRLGRKADGTLQKTHDPLKFSKHDTEIFTKIADQNRAQEEFLEKEIEKKLKEGFPIYTEWLSVIKGIGSVTGGVICSEFDINIADTVSKMTQYSGFNPDLVYGKIRISKEKYKSKIGKIISEIKNTRTKKIDYIVLTDAKIPGDRATAGFLLPYNKNLKAYLLGTMAEKGFIMQKNSYYRDYYLPKKHQLENSNKIAENQGKKRKDDGKAWKDVSKGRRHNAARRYMVKMFLIDLYVAWREIEGLPVRKSYAEEYLGKKHKA